MPPSDKTTLVRSKLERADTHIGQLDTEISAYGISKPYEIRAERDTKLGQITYYLAGIKDVPIRLDIIDKHRTILTLGVVHGGIGIGSVIDKMVRDAFGTDIPPIAIPARITIRTPKSGKSAKVGDVLHVGFFCDEEVNKNLEFPCEVVIAESGVFEGKPLLETLLTIGNVVEDLISGFAPFLV